MIYSCFKVHEFLKKCMGYGQLFKVSGLLMHLTPHFENLLFTCGLSFYISLILQMWELRNLYPGPRDMKVGNAWLFPSKFIIKCPFL